MGFQGTGRYQVSRQLGAGGFGEVYEAIDRQRGDRVALKTLRRLDPDSLYRFKKEFRSLADLSHPNLVSLHELAAEDEHWFFTMELVVGQDFISYVRGRGGPGTETTLPAADESPTRDLGPTTGGEEQLGGRPAPGVDAAVLRPALRQLAQGVSALHAAGKLHRDIKPTNVLVTGKGRVKLLDFGLVTEAGAHSTDDQVVGTAAYMAPEQAMGGKVSEAADWYSVGVMLYEALTGRLPHEGERLQVLIDKQRRDPIPPRDLDVGAPEDLSDLCMALLSREPDRRPTAKAIIARLDRAVAPAPTVDRSPPADRSVFVGREQELAALGQAFAASQEGGAVIAVVRGRSGIGKTTVVQRFLAEHREHALVLAGRCYERESVPYKALDSVIDALCHHLRSLERADASVLLPRDAWALSRLFPVLQRVSVVAEAPAPKTELSDRQEQRRRAFAAAKEMLTRIADRRPLVLSIDDLHWDDADSAALLEEVFATSDPPAALLVLSCRSEDVDTSHTLARLAAARQGPGFACALEELELGPLQPEEVEDLTGQLLGQDADTRALREAVARESAGLPLFVHQLVRFAHARQVRGAPLSLEQVLADRIQQLPDPARRLLQTVAAAGHPVSFAQAWTASRPDGADARKALAALVEGSFVRRREPDSVEVLHDRIREAAAAGLSPRELSDLHGRLAAALEAMEQPDPEVLTQHFKAAGRRDKTVRYAALAADRAAQAMAFDRAAHYYRLALESSEEREAQLRIKLGQALAHAGRGVEAARVYLEAARGAAGDQAVELHWEAGEQLLRNGHWDEGLRTIEPALKAVGLKLPRSRRAAVLAGLARHTKLKLRGLRFKERRAEEIAPEELRRLDVCIAISDGMLFDPEYGMLYYGALVRDLALRAGEPGRLALVFLGYALSQIGRGRFDKARAILQLARQLAERSGDPRYMARVPFGPAVALAFQGRWAEALVAFRALGEGLDLPQDLWWERSMQEFWVVTCLFYLGRTDEFARCALQEAKATRDRGDLFSEVDVRARWTPMVWLMEDQPGRALQESREAISRWSLDRWSALHGYAMWTEAEALLYDGQAAAALSHLDACRKGMARAHLMRSVLFRAEHQYLQARCALAAGLTKPAAKLARALHRSPVESGPPWARLIEAGVAIARGRRTEAASLLEQAAAACEQNGMALHAACARRRQGELLGDDEGRRLVAAADALMRGRGIKNPRRWTALHLPG